MELPSLNLRPAGRRSESHATNLNRPLSQTLPIPLSATVGGGGDGPADTAPKPGPCSFSRSDFSIPPLNHQSRVGPDIKDKRDKQREREDDRETEREREREREPRRSRSDRFDGPIAAADNRSLLKCVTDVPRAGMAATAAAAAADPLRLKSLTSACVTTAAGRSYDIVAVSFWLAALHEGCSLVKLAKAAGTRGQTRLFVMTVEGSGALSIKWEKQGLMGKVAKSAQLLSTESSDAKTLEFLMETSLGSIFARAPTHEWFLIWTEGMVSILEYARSVGQSRGGKR